VLKTPKKQFLLGHLVPYIKDPWGFVNHCHQAYGERVELKMLNQRVLLLANPADIHTVLQTKAEAFAKGRTFQKLKLLLGEGLITSEGEIWRRQNRLMRPVFGVKNIQNLVPAIEAIIKSHCRWREGQRIDGHREMNALTLKIIARTLFDLDLSEKAPAFLGDVEFMMGFLIKRVRSLVALPLWWPSKSNREFRAARERFDQLTYGLIQERRAGKVRQNDLLQTLIDAREDDGARMGDQQIRDEIITILMAGHETITNTMAWTMILLAQHPDWQQRLTQASDEECGAVIEEAMRLWPPVWAFMRQAKEAVEVNGVLVKPGDICFLMPYFVQRSEKFWHRPTRFRPERFFGETKEKFPAGAYLPFGLGPRMCIGKMFAMVEAKLILRHLVTHYRWQIENETEQGVEAGITLRPTTNTVFKLQVHRGP